VLQVAPRTEGRNRFPPAETLSPSSQLLFSLTSRPDVLGIEVRHGLNRWEEFKQGKSYHVDEAGVLRAEPLRTGVAASFSGLSTKNGIL